MKLKPLHLLLAAILGSTLPSVWAIDPFTVRDIKVEGLQRTDLGTVFNYLPVKVGERFDDARATESIKALFSTGFFDDVRVERDGDVLIITVEERPTIAQININGSKLLEKDQIRQALRSQNFAEGRIFEQGVLDAAVNELKQQYFSRGRYSVIIKTQLTKLERNRMGVQFDISEGEVARIQRINIVGAKVFKEGDLIDEMALTTPNWMTWYTRTDQYSKPKLQADQEALRSYYLDRGYLEMAIDSTQVAISEDRESVYLTLNITEGERYTVSDIKLVGDSIVGADELQKLLEVKGGDVFSRQKLNKSTAAITDRLADEGYAFANVNAVPQLDKEKHTVSFTVYVDPGRKVYVRRINVAGNNLTRDEVIRRELRQLESAQYDGSKVKRSKQRLNQLDYFSEVNIDTAPVPDAPDEVDMNVNVVEKKTGQFNIGAGYGQSEGVVFVLSLSQNNFLGSGKRFTAEFNNSSANKVYSFSLLEPYLTPDGISVGYNLYRRDTDPGEMDIGDYSTSAYGGSVRFGFPTSETNRVNVGLALENLKLQTTGDSPKRVLDFISRNGDTNMTYTASVNWSRDTRDSASYPTRGMLTSLGAEVTIPGSDLDYYKTNISNQLFIPIYDTTSLMWNVDIGWGGKIGDSEFPFYKNYYAGGVSSIRGYEYGTVGPKDENGDGMGGTKKLVNNIELLFPIPGMKDDKSTRLSLFTDLGGVWDEDTDPSTDDLRYSAGVAFTWISPIGPIKLSYAKPFNAKDEDKTESFQFQLGNVF
ncbi:outer membrane protein assembly factor BamA [Chitiniphilus eburneus]|uniref:Outer membrane protein assembly factor BamA n=1 Tax=Chitiniphilus eburneus TaxID=2571148 RepID=A0A4U0QJB7_9NEIS|nr:outer membrane protein assembly factor BamA [Chitiniphilus eburneus]TJZ76154.1 outer membrane protein assembly factor BamA [Chitiniphilus eburneus]